MASNDITFILNFVKIGKFIQKLGNTQREHNDFSLRKTGG